MNPVCKLLLCIPLLMVLVVPLGAQDYGEPGVQTENRSFNPADPIPVPAGAGAGMNEEPAEFGQTLSSEKLSFNPANPTPSPARRKISSDLTDMLPSAQDAETFRSVNILNPGGQVSVYIQVNPDTSVESVIPHLTSVLNIDEKNHRVTARMNISDVESLAAQPYVRSIRTVIPPVINTGSVNTQGDTVLRSIDVRGIYGYDGTGMKVGVISDGANNWMAAALTGDLPPDVNILSDAFPDSNEGAAMMQIVHDVAPGATLYFHDWSTDVLGFNDAVDQLKNNGCTVIVDDVTFLDEPFFEDGPVASHITNLVDSGGLVYVTSAGNWAQQHYQGSYFNDGTGFHDFSRGTSMEKNLYVTIPAGRTIRMVLQWNDKFGDASDNFDLYLLNSADNSVLGTSTNMQPDFVDPLEYLAYTNYGSVTVNAKIAVKKVSGGTTPKTLGVLIYNPYPGTVSPVNIAGEGSISGHAAARNVVTVAAANWMTPAAIEPYSSRGPVSLTWPVPSSRQKPDITGVDGVSILPVGSFTSPFSGTSAAAPHIAGIIALEWGGNPSFSSQDIRNSLYNAAIDLGTPGRDNTFGYGRVDALQMAASPNITSPVPPPVAGFSATPRSGTVPLAVAFTDLSTNTPSGWTWSFGDGTPDSAAPNPVHTYHAAGVYPVSLTVSNEGGNNTVMKAGYIRVSNDTVSMVGVYRPPMHTFYLRPAGYPAVPVAVIPWGATGDIPVTGDWDGNGVTDVGVYRPSAHAFYLRPAGYPAVPVTMIPWGASGDIPVTGDWDGNGVTDVGMYRPSVHAFYLRPAGYPAVPVTMIPWGASGDIPVTGDWEGNGATDVGVYRPSVHTFFLRNPGYPGNPATEVNWGLATDLPLT